MQEWRDRQGQNASVMFNGVFFAAQAQSGRGLLHNDPQAFSRILPGNAEPESIGSTLREALSASRFLTAAEARHFFSTAEAASGQQFLQELCAAAGVDSRAKLFKGMRLCHVALRGDTIKFGPTARVKREAWEGLGAESEMFCSSSASNQEIAGVLNAALAQCRG